MRPFLPSLAFCLATGTIFAQVDFDRQASMLAQTMATRHVAPKPIDDAFSKLIFDGFLEKIDPEKIYFTEEDVAQLRIYENRLDDEFAEKKWNFLNAFAVVLRKNLARCQGFLEVSGKVPVAATLKTPLHFAYTPAEWSKDESALRQRWQRLFTYAVFEKVRDHAHLDSVPVAKLDDTYFLANEAAARERAAQMETRKISLLQNPVEGFEAHLRTVFLNAFATCFDPHSGYFTNADREKFMASFSAEGYSFGFDMEEDPDGKIQLAGIVPGSPAWRNGQLSTSDQIVSIKAGNKKVDATVTGLRAAEKLIDEGNTIELTVKKKNGTYRSVILKKEKTELEENVVRSYVLQRGDKIGYIALPGFYSSSDDKTEGLRCANDVAKEIVKLKKENIEGLIFDLRNNGGGSLQEALSMAGIFIDEGPLGMVRGKDGVSHVVKDNNRGTVYDGPLLIMTNTLSASASEFFAAALQDYNRAIVVGSTTFGKGTGQVMVPLRDEKNPSPDAFAKVTVHKIYRVTGRTVQGQGLTPDILLPDALQSLPLRESRYKNFLTPDSLLRKPAFVKLPAINVSLLKAQSKSRLASGALGYVQDVIDWVEEQHKKTFSIASWGEFVKFSDALTERITRLDEKHGAVTFAILDATMNRHALEADPYRDETNRRYIDELKNDQYLQECFTILKDWIQSTTKR